MLTILSHSSAPVSTGSHPQKPRSSEFSCHQIQSVTSSQLRATPVTLPALSLYPQASSITYRAGHSSGDDVTASPQDQPLPKPCPQCPLCKAQRPRHHGRPRSNRSGFRINRTRMLQAPVLSTSSRNGTKFHKS